MLFVLELGDRELHLLDQQRTGADLGFEIACLGFRRELRRLAGEHQRLQRRDIIGERIGCNHHRRWNHSSARHASVP